MNARQHYLEAERLLSESQIPPSQRATSGWRTADELLAAAQVHAILAVASQDAEADLGVDAVCSLDEGVR